MGTLVVAAFMLVFAVVVWMLIFAVFKWAMRQLTR